MQRFSSRLAQNKLGMLRDWLLLPIAECLFFFFFAPSNSKLCPHSVSMIVGSSLVKFGEVLQLPNLEELYANLKANEQKDLGNKQ